MITARAGLRIVQQRVSHLRRAVVAEVEDINRLIYHVLRAGVVVSVAILVFGFVLVTFTGHSIPDRSIPPRALGQPLNCELPGLYVDDDARVRTPTGAWPLPYHLLQPAHGPVPSALV